MARLRGWLVLLSWLPAIAQAQEFEPSFQVNGFLQNQTGLFFNTWDRNTWRLYPEGYVHKGIELGRDLEFPVDHGSKGGQLSMFRNTLQLEADWNPFEGITLHALARGVLSLPLAADRDAQVPRGDVDDKKDWVWDNYYNEIDLRELYLDIDAGPLLNFRVGRQQVTWGEVGSYRLLDVVNPVDNTWHFGPLESFEDTRIPLWIVKALIDIPPAEAALELVWVPGIDDPEDTVAVPLTFVGAWGLPEPPIQTYNSTTTIRNKIFKYPGRGLRHGRGGFNWKGSAGPLTYTLVYYFTHQLTPPVPRYFVNESFENPNKPGSYQRRNDVDVYLEFPRQHVVGGSLEFTLPYPIGAVMRLETAVELFRTFPVNSVNTSGSGNTFPHATDSNGNPVPLSQDLVTYFNADAAHPSGRDQERAVVNWAVQFMRPNMWRWLNPEQNTMLVLQWNSSLVPGIGRYEKRFVDIPGYDSTAVQLWSNTLIVALFTSYLHGMLTPRIAAAVLFPQPWQLDDGAWSGFVTAQLGMTFGVHWRIATGINYFWGTDPYNGAGMFRDRDEVFLQVRYQF